MRTRLRWLAVAMAGMVVVAAAITFAPRPIPPVPATVRLEGEVVTAIDPSTNELVVVPAPSVDLGGPIPVTTTMAPAPTSTTGQAPAPVPQQSGGSDDGDDSADNLDSDDSADSPDD
ncbi:MAG: hypothetical protein ACRDX9_16230 [Acidimicrobiia bacterium]